MKLGFSNGPGLQPFLELSQMKFDMESILAAKAKLEKLIEQLGPIKRYLEVTPAEYATLKHVLPSAHCTPEDRIFGLELRIVEPQLNPLEPLLPNPKI